MSAVHRRSVLYSQNFLRDARLVDRLLARSSIGRDDVVVEIGSGRGLVTERLAARCRHVVAVEKDRALSQHLRERLSPFGNVVLFEADFLHFPLPVTPYKVFANIPFNVTTAIVSKLTSGSSPPDDAYLVVQWEAAERFVGAPRESLTAVLLKPWFEPSIGHRFSATDFAPPPGVETALLRLRRRNPPLVAAADAARFRDFVVFAFTAWQPDLRGVLARLLPRPALARIERAAAVDLDRRPTATPFEAWLRLFAAVRAVGDHRAWQTIEGAEARLRHQQSGLQKIHRTRSSPGTRR
jgi:23S rRNA (adenine-N6)-dimethyltransferase